MMGQTELCKWLRENSSGIYRPASDAADEIEHLAASKDQHFQQAMLNGAKANELRFVLLALDERLKECSSIPASAADAYDSYYRDMVAEALKTPNV